MGATDERILWRGLLGMVGVAQWVVLALTWFDAHGDGEMTGPFNGWRLLQAGLTDPDDGGAVIAFVVGAMPPLAWLLALALIAGTVVGGGRGAAKLTVATTVIAGLGVLGLYTVGSGGDDREYWDFHPALFAGLVLWAVAAGLAGRYLAALDED